MEWEDYDRYAVLELKNIGVYTFDKYLKDITQYFSFKNKSEINTIINKNKKFFKQCFDDNIHYSKAVQNLDKI